MGCPAKKVCNVAAGSALLAQRTAGRGDPRRGRARRRRAGDAQDPHRPRRRDTATRSRIARIAEDAGIARARRARPHARLRLRRPGRVRHDPRGQGGGRDPGDRQRRHRHRREQAKHVLDYTGADALMIGRAAQGRPWIFREIRHFLDHGTHLPPPTVAEAHAAIARASRRPLRVLRRSGGRAHRAQASRLVHEGPRRRRRFPPRDERGGDGGRAARARSTDFSTRSPAKASASTTAPRDADRRRCARRVRAGAHSNRNGAGRPWPREKDTTHQRQQRDRQDRREIARRVFPQARRRAVRTASTTW